MVEKFYVWCKVHDLPYNYTDPEYRLGRIRLGEVIGEWTMQGIQEFVTQFPNIIEIVALNDK